MLLSWYSVGIALVKRTVPFCFDIGSVFTLGFDSPDVLVAPITLLVGQGKPSHRLRVRISFIAMSVVALHRLL